jgi:hypothetical protein
MTARPFKPGDRVVITTVDLGSPSPVRGTAKRPHRIEEWAAIVVQPSPLGDDLWLVRKEGGRGKAAGVYTVPAAEMKRGSA